MDLTKYRDKLVGSEDERAVSPVIGIILMVAITVILAAVIAAFVLDMGPEDPDPQAVIDDEQTGDEVEIELQGTTDADGIIVWNESDGIVNDKEGVLTTTGESHEFNISDGDTIQVIAFSGDEPDVYGEEDVDELGLDNYAIVDEFESDD